jgi:hypothetical protein
MTRNPVFMKGILVLALFLGCHLASAQGLPATDVYLADLHLARPDGPLVDHIRPVTRRDGYDNQPSFSPDGSTIFFTSERDGQTDIFRFDLANDSLSRVTHTPTNEYSPFFDGERLLAIRDEDAGRFPWGLHLWEFDPNGSPRERARLAVSGTGFYALAESGIVFFRPDDYSLVFSAEGLDEPHLIANRVEPSIPRTLPGRREVSFVDRDTSGVRWIRAFDTESFETRDVAALIGDVIDYAWTPDGRLIMADGVTFHILDPLTQATWQATAPLPMPGVRRITRPAVSPDGRRLAFVVEY